MSEFILLVYILPVLSILFSLVALMVGIAALSMVIGLKNSTHQVVFKPVDLPKEEKEPQHDPFFTVEDEVNSFSENPNKRQKKEEPFADLDDPGVTSNGW